MADLQAFLSQIKSTDANVRFKAWEDAGPMGPAAIEPLADLMKEDERTVGRAAKEAAQRIVMHSSRPGAQEEARATAAALLKAAGAKRPRHVRVELLHWLGLVGGPEVVPGLVKLLDNADVREDARMALENIPGDESLKALQQAEGKVPGDFKKNIHQSLRARKQTRATVGITKE